MRSLSIRKEDRTVLLHEKDMIKASLLDKVYVTTDLSVSMPKFKMSEHEHVQVGTIVIR
jgi:hypothetical protein